LLVISTDSFFLSFQKEESYLNFISLKKMPENKMNKAVMLAMVWFGNSHSEGQTYTKLGVTKKRKTNFKK